jgi:hypothetical protein
MPLQNQVPQWKDWSEEERQRFQTLAQMYKQRIHIPLEDYKWFMLRRRNLGFYKKVRARALSRLMREAAMPFRSMVVSGFNTCTR